MKAAFILAGVCLVYPLCAQESTVELSAEHQSLSSLGVTSTTIRWRIPDSVRGKFWLALNHECSNQERVTISDAEKREGSFVIDISRLQPGGNTILLCSENAKGQVKGVPSLTLLRDDTVPRISPEPPRGDAVVKNSPAEKLRISNPFYQPYRGEWFVTAGAGYAEQKYRVDAPAQLYSSSGFTVVLPAGATEDTYKSTSASANITYGIADRINLGVTGHFLLNRSVTTVNSGSFSSMGGGSVPSSGVYAPEFNAGFRLAGTHKNSWYLDAKAAFTPGIKSSDPNTVASPQADIRAGLAAGRNYGAWTASLGATVDYFPETTNNGTTVGQFTTLQTQAFLQYDYHNVFGRGGLMLNKYFNATFASEEVIRKLQAVLQAEFGVHFRENIFSTFIFRYQFPVSADMNFTGLRATGQLGPIIGGGLTLGFRL